MIRPAILLAALLLGACQNPAATRFDQEAGIADPGFGLAVRSNELVMRGHAPLVSLQTRFAAEVPAIVTFPFDSAALDAGARRALDLQASWMRQFPEVGFAVQGHADAPGPSPYNEALGRRRAEAVVAHLAARGVDRGRLRALVSFGESQPVVATAGRARLNRRALTQVSGFVARHPTVLDGQYAQIVARQYVASATAAPDGAGLEATSE